jgi:hypothetical protein
MLLIRDARESAIGRAMGEPLAFHVALTLAPVRQRFRD